MASANANTIESPCLNICVLDEEEICQGCFRSLEDIRGWSAYSEDKKLAVLHDAEQRKNT